MNLHDNEKNFSDLVEATAEFFGLPRVYIEKDYWITKALKFLSESKHLEKVVFKGGTSLSKAYKLIDRFSEDIDLAVLAPDQSGSSRKKLLKDIEAVVTQGLNYLQRDERESKGSKFRKTVYQYPRNINGDFGQASPELLIEINTFANPEPFESKKLQTLIAEVLIEKDRGDLVIQYDLQEFSVNVLSVKRTLVEKILGMVKDSYNEEAISKLSNRIRHLYDICLILKNDEYRNFVASSEFPLLCEICIKDEMAGFFVGSNCFENPLVDAPLFSEFKNWRRSLDAVYVGTFSDLVYGELPTMDEIESTLIFIKKSL